MKSGKSMIYYISSEGADMIYTSYRYKLINIVFGLLKWTVGVNIDGIGNYFVYWNNFHALELAFQISSKDFIFNAN